MAERWRTWSIRFDQKGPIKKINKKGNSPGAVAFFCTAWSGIAIGDNPKRFGLSSQLCCDFVASLHKAEHYQAEAE